MKKRKKDEISSLSKTYLARTNKILARIAKEAPAVWDELAAVIPSYTKLLSLHAKTFEEFSLIRIAKERKIDYTDPLFSYDSIKPRCQCGETKRISRAKENTYLCNACKTKFVINPNSIVSGSRCPSITWMQVLHCMLECYSIQRACEYCNITPLTFYYIRNRLVYAMEILLEDMKLYGVIQCDNTYFHISYKGYCLSEEYCSDDDMFDEIRFIPRSARARGGAYSKKEQNKNSICVFAAIDEFGHVIVRRVGIGNPNTKSLLNAVPSYNYLTSVPEQDPFLYSRHKNVSKDSPSTSTLLVADEELAIGSYARKIGIECEQHDFSQNGVFIKLPAGAHNIQRANALHSRLKAFIAKTNYASAKYLPLYLTLFEFIENTGASNEAIGRLFEILVEPGRYRSSEYFEEKYKTPNYIAEWFLNYEPLKKFSFNDINAAYLYSMMLKQREAGVKNPITMNDIMEETGFRTDKTIKRKYKNMVASGVMDIIHENMGGKSKIIDQQSRVKTHPKGFEDALKLYDRFCEHLMLPVDQQMHFYEFMEKTKTELGIKLAREPLRKYFLKIEEMGIRDQKLSELKKQRRIKINSNRSYKSRYSERNTKIYYEYEVLRNDYKNKGEKITSKQIFQELAIKHKISPTTVESKVYQAKNYIKDHPEIKK